MSIEAVLCGPCSSTENNRNASKWCTNCEEGFCRDCEKVHTSSKISKDHILISVDDYNKIADVLISQTCKIHGKSLEMYCKTHDVPLCVVCVTTNHKTCSEMIRLEDVVKNARHSAELANVEETIDQELKKLISRIKDRNSVLKDVGQNEQFIKEKINDIRTNLNEHLDKLEQKLLLQLTKKLEVCQSNTTKKLLVFETAEKQLNQLKNEISHLKTYASDLQVFLGTRQIKRAVIDHVSSVKTAINDTKNYNLELQLDPTINQLLDVNDLGNIEIVETKENDEHLQFTKTYVNQAQMPITKEKTVHDTQVHLKYKFQIKKGDKSMISGCTMLPNGHILIADYRGKKQVMEYSDNGEHIRDIPVSSNPFHMTLIDIDRVAVSYGRSEYIEILDIKNNVVKKINVGNYCYGISYQDGKLYIVVYEKGILIMDLIGKILYTVECDVKYVAYLKTSEDRIYYTDFTNNTIHAFDMKGEQIWVFKDQSIFEPMGLSVDNKENVYVVGKDSNNLTLIQHDSTQGKILLTGYDGLDSPSVVYYDIKRKLLVVCNQGIGNVALFSVI